MLDEVIDGITNWRFLALSLLLLIAVELYNALGRALAATKKAEADDPRDQELRELRSTAKELKARSHELVAYFVSYNEAIKRLAGAVGVKQVTAGCVQALTGLFETQNVALLLVDNGGNLRVVEGKGISRETRRSFVLPAVDTDRSLASLLEAGVVCVLEHHRQARACVAQLGEIWELAAPIWDGGNLVGVVLVANAVGEEALVHRVLAMVADLTGASLAAARQVEDLTRAVRLENVARKRTRRTLHQGRVSRVPMIEDAPDAPLAKSEPPARARRSTWAAREREAAPRVPPKFGNPSIPS